MQCSLSVLMPHSTVKELQVIRYTGSVSWRLSIKLGLMDKLGQDASSYNF